MKILARDWLRSAVPELDLDTAYVRQAKGLLAVVGESTREEERRISVELGRKPEKNIQFQTGGFNAFPFRR
jgi:hypothetical protein